MVLLLDFRQTEAEAVFAGRGGGPLRPRKPPGPPSFRAASAFYRLSGSTETASDEPLGRQVGESPKRTQIFLFDLAGRHSIPETRDGPQGRPVLFFR